MTLSPNRINVVANQVVMTVDLRNTDDERLRQAEQRLLAFADEAAAIENVGIARRSLARFAPVAFAPNLVERVEAIANELGFPVKRLPSGAGHHAQIMAAVCPACMIFVPSVGGISHNVEEYTAPADLVANLAICTDGLMPGPGQKPHPRSLGALPKALRMGIPLAQMVWRLSMLPCRFLKLPDPTLKIGADASLVLFDLNSVCERNDYADDGIDVVWVHGELVLDHGKLTAPRRFPGPHSHQPTEERVMTRCCVTRVGINVAQ